MAIGTRAQGDRAGTNPRERPCSNAGSSRPPAGAAHVRGPGRRPADATSERRGASSPTPRAFPLQGHRSKTAIAIGSNTAQYWCSCSRTKYESRKDIFLPACKYRAIIRPACTYRGDFLLASKFLPALPPFHSCDCPLLGGGPVIYTSSQTHPSKAAHTTQPHIAPHGGKNHPAACACAQRTRTLPWPRARCGSC